VSGGLPTAAATAGLLEVDKRYDGGAHPAVVA